MSKYKWLYHILYIALCDLPSNCTVVGNPAYIVIKDNERVNLKL